MDLRVGCAVSSPGVEDKRPRLWQESAKGGQGSRYSKVWAEQASSETFLDSKRMAISASRTFCGALLTKCSTQSSYARTFSDLSPRDSDSP